MLLRVASANRAGVSIYLLAIERRERFHRRDTLGKEEARGLTLDKWQREWEI